MTCRPSHGRHARRSGVSLIETSVAVAVAAVLSGIVVAGMVALMRYNHSVDRHWVEQTAMQQMMTTVRGDIHLATSFRCDAGDQSFHLELPGRQRIEYRRLEGRWVRIATATEGGPITTSFGLGSMFRRDCLTASVKQGEAARLQFANTPEDLSDEVSRVRRTVQCEVIAVVGRDHDLLHD